MQRSIVMKIQVVCAILSLAGTIAAATQLKSTHASTGPAGAVPRIFATAASPRAGPMSTQKGEPRNFTINIDNFNFSPKELTVSVGDTVTWINRDDLPHTATGKGDPAAFDSKALDTGDKYSFTFAKPGTFEYYCKIHTHMTGVIIVK